MSIGHNSTLTDEERQALWGHHIAKRAAIQRRKDELKAEEDAIKANSKNDGLSEKEIKDYLDCMFSTDKQKKVDQFNMLKRNRIRLGLIVDDRKGDLFSDRVTTQEMIFAAGVEAGLAGLDRVSGKYACGSDEERAFLDGWDEGQRIARENLQTAMEKLNRKRTKEEAPPTGDDPFSDND